VLPSIPKLADVDGGVTKHTAGAATLFAAIMADAPLGYWRTKSGADETANALTLTGFNTPADGTSLDASNTGNPSIALNGTNNLFDNTLYAALDLTGNLSIACLIKPTSLTVSGADVVRKGNQYGLFIDTNSKLQGLCRIGGSPVTVVGATTLAVNTTYYVGMSYDGANIKAYLNGVQDGVQAATGAVDVTHGAAFSIGIFANGFTGFIDEVALYSAALAGSRFAAYASAAGV
jgi:hypothetical protein